MLSWLRHWLTSAFYRARSPETSRLIVGSTGSGKSEGELVDLMRLAERRDCAVVLLDGHGPLAFAAAGHWGARGHEPRMVYEPLEATDRVLCWHMLPKSLESDPSKRLIEDAETQDEVAQCFLVQRNLGTLDDKPLTKEWLEAAITLCLSQPTPETLPTLLAAFRIGSPEYERLLAHSDQPEIVAKFRNLERLRRKSEMQYEIQTGASRRLLELVCNSEIVRLRSRPGPFDWLQALREQKLIAFDGGGIRSRSIKRTLFLLASMQVIQAVRRHFAETQAPLPVVLILEEAGALGLVTPFVMTALQELRKAGLSLHLITQSTVDFGNRDVFESILANIPWQAWYQVLSTADQELGAKSLTNAAFDANAVHFTRERAIQDGFDRLETLSRGETFERDGRTVLRHDRRTGIAFRSRYRQIADAYYKSPQLFEQEFRTKLATLRIGERFVRDRDGVRREQVIPLRPPRRNPVSDLATHDLIERLRRQAIYQYCPSPQATAPVADLRDAAARLCDHSSP